MSLDRRALRAQLKERRDGLAEGHRAEASRRICAQIADLVATRPVSSLAAFWPYGSEVDLRPLFTGLAIPIWFPRVAQVRPPHLTWGQPPLAPGRWGLLEPEEAPLDLPPVDLVLVPGLAFDPSGYRMGYGGGFYDALLAQLEGVPTLGVGFDVQRTAGLPLEPQDWPVDALVTESGMVRFRTGPLPGSPQP